MISHMTLKNNFNKDKEKENVEHKWRKIERKRTGVKVTTMPANTQLTMRAKIQNGGKNDLDTIWKEFRIIKETKNNNKKI